MIDREQLTAIVFGDTVAFCRRRTKWTINSRS